MKTAREQVQALDAVFGAPETVKLDDGRVFRLHVEIDETMNINDEEFHGRIGWPASRYGRDTGREMRPDGFDGNAEKLQLSGDAVWWQPPTGLAITRGTPEWSTYRSFVADLAEYGYKGVVLEQLDGEDAYGRPIVTAVASLWGIDSLDNGYLAEVAGDLYDELTP